VLSADKIARIENNPMVRGITSSGAVISAVVEAGRVYRVEAEIMREQACKPKPTDITR
jgi:hypothetical protein